MVCEMACASAVTAVVVSNACIGITPCQYMRLTVRPLHYNRMKFRARPLTGVPSYFIIKLVCNFGF